MENDSYVKWFISKNDEVRGPFSEIQVQAQLDARLVSSDCLIWTKGMPSWQNINQWETQLKNQAITPTQIHQRRLWHYAIDSQSFGPIPYALLLEELKKYGDRANEAQLWTKGMKNWVPLYDFHQVMDELEINRRQVPRASIEGQVVIKIDSNEMIGVLKSISQGGFGANRIQGLTTGQIVTAEIRSKDFTDSIIVKAEVRYLEDSGYAGFLFHSINRESTAAIIQYIKTQAKVKAAA